MWRKRKKSSVEDRKYKRQTVELQSKPSNGINQQRNRIHYSFRKQHLVSESARRSKIMQTINLKKMKTRERKTGEREREMGKRNRVSFSYFNNNKNLLFLSFARSRSRDCRQAIDASRCNLFIILLLPVVLLVLYGVWCIVVCGTT